MSRKVVTADAMVLNSNKFIVNVKDPLKPFYIKLDNIESRLIFPSSSYTDTYILTDSGDQTLTGNYEFTNPVSGPDPVDDANFVTKQYLDAALAGIGVVDEYITKGIVTVSTTGGMSIAASVVVPYGAYLVELKAVFRNNVDTGSVVQLFHFERDIVTGNNIIEGVLNTLSDDPVDTAVFELVPTPTGFNILAGGNTATWRIVYKVMSSQT